MRAAIYARCSTLEQHTDNQLLERRRYCEARGWTVVKEVVDHISGAKEQRPALDDLLKDAKRRRFDVVCVWSLDRAGRSLKHLITLLDEFQALGIVFISLKEGLEWTTPCRPAPGPAPAAPGDDPLRTRQCGHGYHARL